MLKLLIQPIATSVEGIYNFLTTMLNEIKAIPATLCNLIKDMLTTLFKGLFVPADGYFDGKIDEIKNKFTFAESIIDTVQVFFNFFKNNSFSEPPVITVNLSSGTSSKINYGTSAKAIDFSWFEPYRDTTHALISSVLWVVFIWNTYKGVPSIIGGASSVVDSSAKVGDSL